MYRSTFAVLVAVLVLSGAVQGTELEGENNPVTPDELVPILLEELLRELRAIRTDLIELRLQEGEDQVSRLKRDMERLQAERTKIEAGSRKLEERVASLDRVLSSGELNADEIEVMEEIQGMELDRERRAVDAKLQAMTSREADLRRRLRSAEDGQLRLMERLEQLEMVLEGGMQPRVNSRR